MSDELRLALLLARAFRLPDVESLIREIGHEAFGAYLEAYRKFKKGAT